MRSNNKHIPIYRQDNFRHKYFTAPAIQTGNPLFELYRREDRYYHCQPAIGAHKLDFYMVILITGGEGIKIFGTKEYYIKGGMLCFVPPGMVTSWESIVDAHQGFVLIFNEAFLPQDNVSAYPFFQLGGCPVLSLDDTQVHYFSHYFEEIEKEYNTDHAERMDLIRAFLTIILKKTQQLYQVPSLENSNAGIRLTASFTKLFEEDFKTLSPRSLEDYARQLNVTQNHLNDTVKAVTGKTPGTLIRERIIKEATQLLLHTRLSIAEICYMFNFTDPSYFTRFFKRYTGMTPGQYRSL